MIGQRPQNCSAASLCKGLRSLRSGSFPASNLPLSKTPSDHEPTHAHDTRSARSNSHRFRSTIPISSHSRRTPTQFDLMQKHPIAAYLDEVITVSTATPLKATGQKRVAVLVSYMEGIRTGHANPRGSGPLQTIHKVQFLLHHKTLLIISTSVLFIASRLVSRRELKESTTGGNQGGNISFNAAKPYNHNLSTARQSRRR